jgi:hypothetical protein
MLILRALSRFTPFALIRRWLDVREAEAEKRIAVAAIYAAGVARGRQLEREGASV